GRAEHKSATRGAFWRRRSFDRYSHDSAHESLRDRDHTCANHSMGQRFIASWNGHSRSATRARPTESITDQAGDRDVEPRARQVANGRQSRSRVPFASPKLFELRGELVMCERDPRRGVVGTVHRSPMDKACDEVAEAEPDSER